MVPAKPCGGRMNAVCSSAADKSQPFGPDAWPAVSVVPGARPLITATAPSTGPATLTPSRIASPDSVVEPSSTSAGVVAAVRGFDAARPQGAAEARRKSSALAGGPPWG